MQFITDLNSYQADLIQFEKNKQCDINDKSKLYHLNLEILMTQLISQAHSNHSQLKNFKNTVKTLMMNSNKEDDDEKKDKSQSDKVNMISNNN